jgi:hypothetical protein
MRQYEVRIFTRKNRDTSGFLDLFVWKKESFAFLEFKRRHDRNKESLTPPQKLWIKAAMTAKIGIEKQLFIVSRV